MCDRNCAVLYFQNCPVEALYLSKAALIPSFWLNPAVPFDQSPGDLSESNSMKLPGYTRRSAQSGDQNSLRKYGMCVSDRQNVRKDSRRECRCPTMEFAGSALRLNHVLLDRGILKPECPLGGWLFRNRYSQTGKVLLCGFIEVTLAIIGHDHNEYAENDHLVGRSSLETPTRIIEKNPYGGPFRQRARTESQMCESWLYRQRRGRKSAPLKTCKSCPMKTRGEMLKFAYS